MSADQEYIINGYCGRETFSRVHTCFNQDKPDCTYCWKTACAFAEVSFRISTVIWPPPKNDHWMRMCIRCWNRSVRPNPRYIARTAIVNQVPDHVASIIMGYMD